MAHVSHNTGEQEHYTPPIFIEDAREVMGSIDLDPASNPIAQSWVKATGFFTKADCGLTNKTWVGNVWMNPPYARGLVDAFISKLVSSEQVSQYVVLINNTTETKSGQKILSHCSAACFPFKRIRFIKPNGEVGKSPLQGQMLLYRGENVGRFVSVFSKHGVCLVNSF